MMPENGGIGVFAHEYGHNLGADDLYAYGNGETSAGFWTLMADDWTGYPLGYEPPAPDPMHLDWWGWLNPTVISDPTKVYTSRSARPAASPGAAARAGDRRAGCSIELPTARPPCPCRSGRAELLVGRQGRCDERHDDAKFSIAIQVPRRRRPPSPSISSTISRTEWDFLWVQASPTTARRGRRSRTRTRSASTIRTGSAGCTASRTTCAPPASAGSPVITRIRRPQPETFDLARSPARASGSACGT